MRRVSCAIDCGVALNPDIIASQMESCIAQGLSAAIWQKIEFEAGQVQQANFDTFPFIRMHQTPEIAVEIIAITTRTAPPKCKTRRTPIHRSCPK